MSSRPHKPSSYSDTSGRERTCCSIYCAIVWMPNHTMKTIWRHSPASACDTESINALIATSSRPCVFKPISQTMNFVEILASHRGAKGVFIFRNPLDVVMSFLREYGSSLHELTHDIGYNFMVNRLRDLNITLSDWGPIDAIIERFSGRFSLSSDFASKCALRWLLQHATLQQRGILKSPAVVLIAYEDILAYPEQVSTRLSAHLQANVVLRRCHINERVQISSGTASTCNSRAIV